MVAAASEEATVVTNDMSENKRDGQNANAALLVAFRLSIILTSTIVRDRLPATMGKTALFTRIRSV